MNRRLCMLMTLVAMGLSGCNTKYQEVETGYKGPARTNPWLAAERFLALAQGQAQFIAGCGEGGRYTSRRRTRHVNEAVDAFLRIYPTSA